ncbi:MAG TPA: hypothetical protein VFL72_01625 [Acidimicrobiia bacterium]|nr:hypothetical protein [Acidimicrobiia bacterium]
MTIKRLSWLAPYVLPVTGCILFSAAAFVVALPLGLAVSGVAAFFMEWRVDAERSLR